MSSVYDADAEDFLGWSPLLWTPLGTELAESAALRSGERVLDACSGAGGCALPAARSVGPAGHVDAVDLTEQLVRRLELAANRDGVHQLQAHLADVTTWVSDRPYDVVLCGYGAFFLPDPDRDGRHLVSQLKPGGRFAASTWNRGAMGFVGFVYEAVRAVRPELTVPVRTDRWLDSPALLAGWLERIGLQDVEIEAVTHRVDLTPETAWAFVTGTGLRSLLSAMDGAETGLVKRRLLELIEFEHGWELIADSLIGTGRRGDPVSTGRPASDD
ncbi:Methyltransferase type 11 [Kribbella flavida DSM 17836]|uniref:Methyltransferase type 11 n=1 Tax=Kribbella flavida (strain DSM 17836 / JCM 10339 / NBRC 14399) TaxID=479435 RepID=D2PSJ0_KRIFD|nr:class I SAM-dependent methyltransferase [Kribbella flavida]ADB33128.1 Methyltransferase type 11 [Kribbella flavida DSM 17836]